MLTELNSPDGEADLGSVSSRSEADLLGTLGRARPVRAPSSPHHSPSLCLHSAPAHNSAGRLSPAAIREDKRAASAPTTSLPRLALRTGSLEHGDARHCPAAVMHLVPPKPARGAAVDKAGGPLWDLENSWGLSFPRRKPRGTWHSPEKPALGNLGISMRYVETLQSGCINKAVNADVIAGHARDCVHTFVCRDVSLVNCGRMEEERRELKVNHVMNVRTINTHRDRVF